MRNPSTALPHLFALPVLLVLGDLAPCRAAQLPQPAKNDIRIRYVNYSRDDVTVINVQRGTATRIVLAEDEKIVRDGSASGFPADCSKTELEWCVRAEVGASQVLVKPKDRATHNNLELKTDKRDYSFVFHVLPDASVRAKRGTAAASQVPMYRVIFRYPPPALAVTAPPGTNGIAAPPSGQALLAERLGAARATPRNWKYSKQASPGSADIAPALVFDDGRFTYFRFPANRELPTIFYVSPTGEEGRVNFHMDDHDPELVVVERTGRRFVLRLGAAAVGIWNDAFDPDGVAPADGTTVSGVARIPREGK